MRLFLSWSGDLSRGLAKCLFDWLPTVLQAVKPYMSEESIEKGARWSAHLGKELEEAKFGIVVLTADNLKAPWLHFEAGAIAKSVSESQLAPLAFGLHARDVIPPLSQFQVTEFNDTDFLRLLKSINAAQGNGTMLVAESSLMVLYEKMWPDIKSDVEALLDKHAHARVPRRRDPEEMLDEVLLLTRDLSASLAHPERMLGRSIDSLIKDIIDARFAAEAQLSFSEREKVRALIARWTNLYKEIATRLRSTEMTPVQEEILKSLKWFARYVSDVGLALAEAESKNRATS